MLSFLALYTIFPHSVCHALTRNERKKEKEKRSVYPTHDYEDDSKNKAMFGSRNGTGKYIHFRGFLIPTKQKVPSSDRWVYAPDVSCTKVRPESKGVFGCLS